MYQSYLPTKRIVTLFLTALIVLPTACVSKESINYYWYEGKNKHKLTLDNARWVEFNTNQQTATSSQKEQMLEKSYINTKVYKINKDLLTKSAISLASVVNQQSGTYSELFYDRGEKRALPGGILVSFNKNWNEEKIKKWASSKNLKVKSQLLKSLNLWSIDSPSGLASLNLANQLTEENEVNFASPNWWTPQVIK